MKMNDRLSMVLPLARKTASRYVDITMIGGGGKLIQ
jgi:hypothetical protein